MPFLNPQKRNKCSLSALWSVRFAAPPSLLRHPVARHVSPHVIEVVKGVCAHWVLRGRARFPLTPPPGSCGSRASLSTAPFNCPEGACPTCFCLCGPPSCIRPIKSDVCACAGEWVCAKGYTYAEVVLGSPSPNTVTSVHVSRLLPHPPPCRIVPLLSE